MAGILYLCATPIGNLEDMTFRALRVLKEADLIAAEDTRNSIKLLNHFEIKTPMTSYHEYNKYDKAKTIVEKLLEGSDVALITDAGTPGISDPGEVLVKLALDSGITVTPVPGCCAAVNALIMSGLSTSRFCFEAFLPADKKERRARIEELSLETRTIIVYEAPHHLLKTLSDLLEGLGDRKISVCRELTKKHEDLYRGTIGSAIAHFTEEPPRGEFVLVIEGVDSSEIKRKEQEAFSSMTIGEHLNSYLSQGLDKKEAMKKVAEDRGISKREVYKETI